MIKKIFNRAICELEVGRESRRFGQGWISGALALMLSSISFIVILCLLFPGVFSMPEVRSSINITYVRIALQVFLVLSFILSCISLVLRESKLFGLLSGFIVFASLAIGGANAKELVDINSTAYFGFDWFIINLILSGIVFVPFERVFSRVDQPIFRQDWREDFIYFLISSIMVQSISFLSFLPSNTIKDVIDFSFTSNFIHKQPFLLQLLEIMFLTDLVQYWFHRLMHKVPFLWKFHSIHHSAKTMDWLASSKMHIIEIILLRGITIIPMQVLGFNQIAIYAYLILVYFYSTYVHSNLKFNIECVKSLIVTPRFHHWHHGIEKEAINVNFAIHFPILDRLFGTYYMPKNTWPSGYGVKGSKIKSGIINQFLYPFKKNKKIKK